MWIFCGGMPRSGSTLQFQLTAHLVEHAGLGMRVEWVRPAEFPVLRAKYAAYAGWKVFKIHHFTPAIAAEFAAKNAKGVYIFRDVRDVIVSRMRKTGRSFDALWTVGFLERVLDAFEGWTGLAEVLVSRYDAVVIDVAAEAARIAAHLGLDVSRLECERVAEEYTVARQRERIHEAIETGRLERAAEAYYDPVSNLHINHIRSGRSGEWRMALSAEELAMVEDRAEEWLVANGYPLTLWRWHRAWLKRRYTWRHRPMSPAMPFETPPR